MHSQPSSGPPRPTQSTAEGAAIDGLRREDELERLRAEVQTLARENARLARDLDEARAENERADQRLQSVLATVSHELRTPLQALHVSLELLLTRIRGAADDVPQSWTLGRLELAKRSSTRLTKLVSTMLDVSLIQSGRLDLHPEPLDFSELVGDVVTSARDDLTWAGCECTVSTTGVVAGKWDRVRLELVVRNLLSNAMKYGAGRPIRVQVEGYETSARLTVQDQGVGIAPEDQARIFERFERARTTSHLSGFGLGLWIVKHVVEAMHGSISLTSRPGEGATFVITLPREP
ncbi:sensor histidine kinase [Polyangium aurulentum]|uniref:sensor histidine kinase n=1 Tax=Polyangium aurulentum TaxID=2567896 RepID=UPI0010ADEE4D|nr:HAMP domain-containing sensor histidine kinase [Polyangium aurulentum]UQA61856.1 HAMP domain-containing histidine kinase [Polyangium aurulentum]